jgi:uncharacterized protein
VIVPDINLLLYAYDAASPFHAKAVSWWKQCLSGTEPVGLLHVVVFGFLRVGTNARVFHKPLAPSEASSHIRSWFAQPVVQLLAPGADHTERVLTLLQSLGTGGNLVTDAQIAAAAIENEAILHTSDADFIRFPNLRWFNPISGMGTLSVRRGRPRKPER